MGDDIMLRTTSRVEQLTLEDKTVTECKIIEKSTVVTGRQERLTEEVNVRLTEDLIDEIFARLPIKSLVQFRSLSKSWYCRIASPAFIRMVTTVRSMNTPKKVLIQHVANGGTCKVTFREIDSPTRPIYYVLPRAILFNGALHWVATETSNIRERIMILTFNLSSHVFGTISLPEPSRRAREITIVNGCLGLISRENFTTWVWVMREYDNVASWSLVHELDMTRFNRVRVIKALSNGGLLFGISKYSNYTIYYPETRVLSELLNYKGTSRIVDMEMYVESLELLDKGTPCGNTISWEKERSKEKVSS